MSEVPASSAAPFVEGMVMTAEPESMPDAATGASTSALPSNWQMSMDKPAGGSKQPWRSGAALESTLATSGRWDSYSSTDSGISSPHTQSATRSTVIADSLTASPPRTPSDAQLPPDWPIKKNPTLTQFRLSSTGEVSKVRAKGRGTRELEEILGVWVDSEKQQRGRGSTFTDLTISPKDKRLLPFSELQTSPGAAQDKEMRVPRRQDTLTLWTNTLLGANAAASASRSSTLRRPPMRQRSRSESDLAGPLLWLTPPSHQGTMMQQPAAVQSPHPYANIPKLSPLGQSVINYESGFNFDQWSAAVDAMRQHSFSALNLDTPMNLLQSPGQDESNSKTGQNVAPDMFAVAQQMSMMAAAAASYNNSNNANIASMNSGINPGQIESGNMFPAGMQTTSPAQATPHGSRPHSPYGDHQAQPGGTSVPMYDPKSNANANAHSIVVDPLDQLRKAAAADHEALFPRRSSAYRDPISGYSPSEGTPSAGVGGLNSPSASEALSYAASDDGGGVSGASTRGDGDDSRTPARTIQAAKKRRKEGTKAKFVCELCGETFTRKYNLKGHERAHRNEKPYKCSHPGCDKAFARSHDKKRHELLHSGVRKYHCAPCARDFVRLDALQRHHRSEVGQKCVSQILAGGGTLGYDP